jgi:hypothetical protein
MLTKTLIVVSYLVSQAVSGETVGVVRHCRLFRINRGFSKERSVHIFMYNRMASVRPRNFVWLSTARVSQTLWSSYFSHMITAATSPDQYWHLHLSNCRKTLTYTHTTSRTVLTCDINLGWLTLPAPEAGDFVELLLFKDKISSLVLTNHKHMY